ncbi:hypothetical protein SteCoe_18588 [Stentor coeruleus]|uniref:Uncharacterized protein n=1 Tax=Stentor coeruleus TaxID=5963 RepID=A0A1R2BWB7_9CILI|nr:hypothetical protein SteCoe_18588 [Stentor coeruleus]
MQKNQIVHKCITSFIGRNLTSPYSSCPKQRIHSKIGQFFGSSIVKNNIPMNLDHAPRVQLKNKLPKSIKISESQADIDKSKYLSGKLTKLLSKQSCKHTSFQIYSHIYIELANYLTDFKDLLMILRKGLVISSFKEKDLDDFEFKKDLDITTNDLQTLYNQECKEKNALANKLNKISEDYFYIKNSYEVMEKKYSKYKDIVYGSPTKFIEAKGLIEKMTKQCDIIDKQKNIIQDLQYSEMVLKRLIGCCEKSGISLEDVLSKHGVIPFTKGG